MHLYLLKLLNVFVLLVSDRARQGRPLYQSLCCSFSALFQIVSPKVQTEQCLTWPGIGLCFKADFWSNNMLRQYILSGWWDLGRFPLIGLMIKCWVVFGHDDITLHCRVYNPSSGMGFLRKTGPDCIIIFWQVLSTQGKFFFNFRLYWNLPQKEIINRYALIIWVMHFRCASIS